MGIQFLLLVLDSAIAIAANRLVHFATCISAAAADTFSCPLTHADTDTPTSGGKALAAELLLFDCK
jgi:hypothetical protein